jgi:hypothetical protein
MRISPGPASASETPHTCVRTLFWRRSKRGKAPGQQMRRLRPVRLSDRFRAYRSRLRTCSRPRALPVLPALGVGYRLFRGRRMGRSSRRCAGSSYCLTGECSPDFGRCLTARVPVASLISRPSQSSPSQFKSMLTDVGPVEFVGDAAASSKRSGKSTGLFAPQSLEQSFAPLLSRFSLPSSRAKPGSAIVVPNTIWCADFSAPFL